MKIHKLNNGSSVIITSLHGFVFSDGSVCEGQDKEICDALTLKRVNEKICEINGMSVNRVNMVLSTEQSLFLFELSKKADIVIVPFPVLSAMRESGKVFPVNIVAFNATADTQRSPPSEKIVDINNWSAV